MQVLGRLSNISLGGVARCGTDSEAVETKKNNTQPRAQATDAFTSLIADCSVDQSSLSKMRVDGQSH